MQGSEVKAVLATVEQALKSADFEAKLETSNNKVPYVRFKLEGHWYNLVFFAKTARFRIFYPDNLQKHDIICAGENVSEGRDATVAYIIAWRRKEWLYNNATSDNS